MRVDMNFCLNDFGNRSSQSIVDIRVVYVLSRIMQALRRSRLSIKPQNFVQTLVNYSHVTVQQGN